MDAVVRIEVDIPQAVVTQYGHIRMENDSGLEDMLARMFHTGDVVTVHVVMEATGIRREQCSFINPDSKYRSKCGHVFDANGVCPMQEEHEKATHQLELVTTNGVNE